ncbi:ciliary microtubule inner protein 2B [Liasis olivaceus]
MAPALAPKVSQVLMTPEPHYLPGYGGYCPRYKFTLGQTYGKLTSQLLAAPRRSGRLLLQPNRPPRAPEERPGPGPGRRGRGRGAIPGYTGFIPRAQNHFAKTYGEICKQAWQDFALHLEQGARGQGQAWEAIGGPRLEARVSGGQLRAECRAGVGGFRNASRRRAGHSRWASLPAPSRMLEEGRFMVHLPRPCSGGLEQKERQKRGQSEHRRPQACANEGFPSPLHPGTGSLAVARLEEEGNQGLQPPTMDQQHLWKETYPMSVLGDCLFRVSAQGHGLQVFCGSFLGALRPLPEAGLAGGAGESLEVSRRLRGLTAGSAPLLASPWVCCRRRRHHRPPSFPAPGIASCAGEVQPPGNVCFRAPGPHSGMAPAVASTAPLPPERQGQFGSEPRSSFGVPGPRLLVPGKPAGARVPGFVALQAEVRELVGPAVCVLGLRSKRSLLPLGAQRLAPPGSGMSDWWEVAYLLVPRQGFSASRKAGAAPPCRKRLAGFQCRDSCRAGFTGFVPRIQFLIGASYPILAHQAMMESNQMLRKTGRDSSRRGEALPALAKTYPPDRGLLPHYRGYVPGYKFQFGHTYGYLTCDALGLTTLQKQGLDVTQ